MSWRARQIRRPASGFSSHARSGLPNPICTGTGPLFFLGALLEWSTVERGAVPAATEASAASP
jgi:hypothetical protein